MHFLYRPSVLQLSYSGLTSHTWILSSMEECALIRIETELINSVFSRQVRLSPIYHIMLMGTGRFLYLLYGEKRSVETCGLLKVVSWVCSICEIRDLIFTPSGIHHLKVIFK